MRLHFVDAAVQEMGSKWRGFHQNVDGMIESDATEYIIGDMSP